MFRPFREKKGFVGAVVFRLFGVYFGLVAAVSRLTLPCGAVWPTQSLLVVCGCTFSLLTGTNLIVISKDKLSTASFPERDVGNLAAI